MNISSENHSSENSRVTTAAGIVGLATLFSRISGFIRDVVVAWYFGAGMGADAFFVAFRIPNLLRRLFAEGSLSISFIPVFTDYLIHSGKEEAFTLARSALRLLSILLMVITVFGILFSPIIIRVIAHGFVNDPEKYHLTVFLTQIMFPYVFFICLVALVMGILNVLGHFFAPAFSTVFLNLAIIASVYLISPHMTQPAIGLAIGVLIGGMLQLVFQLPFLTQKGVYFWRKAGWFHPGLKKIGQLMLPTVFGAAVYQINILVGTFLASLLPEGSVSYLYYADRLVEFPLGIFAIATATAVMPSISRQAALGDIQGLKDTFSFAMRWVFFITLPAMVGLIVLREEIVALLFKRGEFNLATSHMTALALLYYGVGLWAFSAVRVVVSTFYALQDTRTPVIMAVISVLANIVLGIILMSPLAHGGLALSTSLASMLNLILLCWALIKRLGAIGWENLFISVGKTTGASFLMGAMVHWLAKMLMPSISIPFFPLLIGIIVCIGTGFLFYAGFSYVLKSAELNTLKALFSRYLKKSDFLR